MKETKRDVFEEFADKWAGLDDERYEQYLKDYDAALPDDLPVIPKAVGEYIKNLRKYHRDLVDVFGKVRDLGITRTEPNGVLIWVAHNTDVFAHAWVLGVWRVEETGEIVKLEE
ncbi:hypothetical protein GRZ59_15555, partial [Lactobacillus paracasei]|uniref:hypothetical protein n=1 Tax=Lacticaseibacillus paracasei TaxID=1597 RepID=UPI001367FB3A